MTALYEPLQRDATFDKPQGWEAKNKVANYSLNARGGRNPLIVGIFWHPYRQLAELINKSAQPPILRCSQII